MWTLLNYVSFIFYLVGLITKVMRSTVFQSITESMLKIVCQRLCCCASISLEILFYDELIATRQVS